MCICTYFCKQISQEIIFISVIMCPENSSIIAAVEMWLTEGKRLNKDNCMQHRDRSRRRHRAKCKRPCKQRYRGRRPLLERNRRQCRPLVRQSQPACQQRKRSRRTNKWRAICEGGKNLPL